MIAGLRWLDYHINAAEDDRLAFFLLPRDLDVPPVRFVDDVLAPKLKASGKANDISMEACARLLREARKAGKLVLLFDALDQMDRQIDVIHRILADSCWDACWDACDIVLASLGRWPSFSQRVLRVRGECPTWLHLATRVAPRAESIRTAAAILATRFTGLPRTRPLRPLPDNNPHVTNSAEKPPCAEAFAFCAIITPRTRRCRPIR